MRRICRYGSAMNARVFTLVVTPIVTAALSGSLLAQAPASASWDRLKAIPVGTHVHVSADSMSRTCNVATVANDALTCTKGRVVNTAHYTFLKGDVRSVKLTRYGTSTAVGVGAGAAVGAVGAAAVTSGGRDTLAGAVYPFFGVPAAILGGVIMGTTDALSGPTVYRR